MRKQKYQSIIAILILQLFCCGWDRCYCAQLKQVDQYAVFERLTLAKQTSEALEIGHVLFGNLVSKYDENVELHDLQRRLEVSRNLAESIISNFEFKRKDMIGNIISIEMPPEFLLVEKHKQESAFVLPPADKLYWVNIENFLREVNLQGLTITELKFVRGYYDLRMRSWIEDIANNTIITNPEFSDLYYYNLVLPLLYFTDNANWESIDRLFVVLGLDNLNAMLDFCLLRVERPDAAIAIAKYKARSKGEVFSVFDWTLAAIANCIENHLIDLAEKLSQVMINNLSDENKIVKLRLKTVESLSKCGDNTKAIEECRQLAKDFSHSTLCGKITHLYFKLLLKHSKADEILMEIDSALANPQCQSYRAQLMCIKWWALRKTRQYSTAKKIAGQLIEDYSDNPCISLILLTHAADALSNQDYKKCRELLLRLTKDFSSTNSALRAKKMLIWLDKGQF